MRVQLFTIKEAPRGCPWCHSIPVIAEEPLYHGHYEYSIVCRNKECKINPRTRSYSDIYDMSGNECIEAAIKDWNDRGDS